MNVTIQQEDYAAFKAAAAKQRALVAKMRTPDRKTGKPRYTMQMIADQLKISRQRVGQILKAEAKAKAAQ